MRIAITVLVIFITWAAEGATYDPVVGMLERHYGGPGTAHVLPDCGCTVRYMGTSVHGRRYTVTLDRLD